MEDYTSLNNRNQRVHGMRGASEGNIAPHQDPIFRKCPTIVASLSEQSHPIDTATFHATEIPDDVIVPMVDRADECRALLEKHPGFKEQLMHALGEAKYREFDRVLQCPRAQLSDRRWIAKVHEFLADTPSLWMKFKFLVGFEHDDADEPNSGARFDPQVPMGIPNNRDRRVTCASICGTTNTSQPPPLPPRGQHQQQQQQQDQDAGDFYPLADDDDEDDAGGSGSAQRRRNTLESLEGVQYLQDTPSRSKFALSAEDSSQIRQALLDAHVDRLLELRRNPELRQRLLLSASHILDEIKAVFLAGPSVSQRRMSFEYGINGSGTFGKARNVANLFSDSRWGGHAFDLWLQTLTADKTALNVTDDEWKRAIVTPLMQHPQLLQTLCNAVESISNDLRNFAASPALATARMAGERGIGSPNFEAPHSQFAAIRGTRIEQPYDSQGDETEAEGGDGEAHGVTAVRRVNMQRPTRMNFEANGTHMTPKPRRHSLYTDMIGPEDSGSSL